MPRAFAEHGPEKMVYDARMGPQAVCREGVVTIAYQAGPGEVLVSEEASQAAGIDTAALESRQLELKGKGEPFAVRVMRIGSG